MEIDELSDEQLKEVAYRCEKRFDANDGMCWDTIEYHIKEMLKGERS